MVKADINDVIITPLKQIFHVQGNIFHGIKSSDVGYKDFGEAYFSTILKGEIKPWKKHLQMTLNLIVPVGEIKFVLFDDRKNSISQNNLMEIVLSPDNYYRLTVPPNIWLAFKGLGNDLNMLLNIADIEHDPNEIMRLDLDGIKYNW